MLKVAACLLTVICLFSGRPALADVIEIDNSALEKLRAGGVAIVDVRTRREWESTGVIEGSHTMTFFDAKGNYDVQAWLSRLNTIVKPDQPLVLICATGVRSASIADMLDGKLGYSRVHNVTQGIKGWIREDREVLKYEP